MRLIFEQNVLLPDTAVCASAVGMRFDSDRIMISVITMNTRLKYTLVLHLKRCNLFFCAKFSHYKIGRSQMTDWYGAIDSL